mgnify:FL=1
MAGKIRKTFLMAFDKKTFDINGRDILCMATFADEDVIAFDNVRDICLNERVKISNFVIALCNKGRGAITINGTDYAVGIDDFIICRPNHIIENMMESMDFECSCLCVSTEFMRNVMLMANSWDFNLVIEENPVIHLDREESEVINAYSTILKNTLRSAPSNHHKEVVEALMRAAACYLTDMLMQHMEAKPHTFYKSEAAFNAFLNLLTSTFPRHRKVDYYSEKLGISNRHLAAVCLRVSGKTALRLITEYAIRDIKRELLKPENTIKQVAVNMGFDNVSSLGRYFRKSTDMSPKAFRAAYARNMCETDTCRDATN